MNMVMNETTVENQTSELHYGSVDNQLKHISEVDSGLDCNCACPHCGSQLIAKKGHIRTHHFAHYESVDCEHGAETAIHQLAKEIIAERKIIQLPAIYNNEVLNDSNQHLHSSSEFTPSTLMQLANVQVESKMIGYQPDLTAEQENGEWLDIEIKVPHEVDFDKSAAQVERQREMLEIDLSPLSRTASRQEITEAVLYYAPRNYIYSFKKDEQKLKVESDLTSTINYVNALITPAEVNPFNNDDSTAITILGYKFGNGYSSKYNSNFNVNILLYAVPAQSHNTRNFSITNSGGFEVKEAKVSEAVIPALTQMTFPLKAHIRYEVDKVSGSQNRMIVTEVLPIEARPKLSDS